MSDADPQSPSTNRTDQSVVARTALGAGWIIGWRFATRFIGLGSTLVLVRLLTPADFGIVALAVGLIQGLDAVAGFGVDGAIIRIHTPGRAIYDAGFTVSVARGVLTSAGMAIAAFPIASFFNNTDLVVVIWVLAAGWAISAFQNVGMVEYRRVLAFDMEFKIKIIPRVMALAVTIPAALIWRSYWALIAGIVTSQILTVILSYVLHPYRPKFGIMGIPQILGFSFWEWIIGLVGLVGKRADTMIIGRLLGTASVGIYSVGDEIASLPSGEIVAPLCRALFSGFVEEKREGNDGSATLLRIMSLLALITFPLNFGLSLVAHPVIELCFGENWLGAVPLIQLLGISSSLSLFNSVGEALFSAHAWLKTILWVTVITTVLRVSMLLLLVPHFGLLGGAMAAAIFGIVQEVIYVIIGLRNLKIGLRKLLTSVIRPALAASSMAVALNWVGLGWNDWSSNGVALSINLFEAVGLGAVVYAVSVLCLWFAVGRPAGAEADALTIMSRAFRH